jgi:tetratricopeptide (TPR) repeat protein
LAATWQDAERLTKLDSTVLNVTFRAVSLVAMLFACGVTGCEGKPAASGGGPAVPAAGTPVASQPPPVAAPGPADAEAQDLGKDLAPFLQLVRQGRTDAARSQLESYRREHPGNGRAAFVLGLTYHREKRYALARPLFEEAARLDPGYHTTYHFLGWCLYYLGEPDASRAAFEKHLTFVDEGDSHFGIGLIDMDRDDLDAAEARFRRSIAIQQDDESRRRELSKAHARLGDVYLRRDDLQGAKAELLLATELWPQHYTAYFKLSRVLARLGEAEAADQAFQLYRHWQAMAELPRGFPEAGR